MIVTFVRSAFALSLTLACSTQAQEKPRAADAPARIVASYVLPAPRLSELQNKRSPGSIDDDHGFTLGGAGSDLWHGPGDAEGEFWLVTDRGPNGEVEIGGDRRRTFHVPAYTPHVLRVRVNGDALEIVSAIALVGGSGMGVSGLPNLAGHDEPAYDASGEKQLAFDSSGLDTEGLVRTKAGEFWLADEYGPSLVHVSAGGSVRERIIPAGLELAQIPDYAVVDSLPRIFAARKANRGFESLALSTDEKRLYTLIQSPLCVPNKQAAATSRNARLLVFDIAATKPVAEFVYQLEAFADFAPGKQGGQDDMKLSGLVVLDEKRLLVLERTDAAAKLYVVDLEGASDILGGRWDDASIAASLEASTDLAAAGVRPLAKRLALDLSTLPGVPPKIEGVAVLSKRRIAIANDNDFDIGAVDSKGGWTGARTPTRVIVIELAAPLY